MKNNINKAILILIVFFAFVLRVYKISQSPPSLNWDEVSLGYNAYSILESAKDEWGKTLPIIFQSYGDYKLPGYIYTLVPFIKIFGLNEFSVRLPSIVAGTISVYLTYQIVKELLGREILFKRKEKALNNQSLIIYNSESVALLSALLVAIEPWSLFLSHPAFEANLALCFFLAGFYFFLRFLNSKFYILHSVFFFGLSVWTYNSYRIFIPIFLLLLVIIYKEHFLLLIKNTKLAVYCLLLTVFFFASMFYQLFVGVGQERYKKVSIIDDGAVGQIINLRNKYNLHPLLERAIFNRPTCFTYNFCKNIVSHFSPNFLFIEGGSNYQFSIPGYGVLYKVNAVFLIIGTIYLIKLKSKLSVFLFGWWILGTVPSSLTREAPHVLRSITILPVPMIITALGFQFINNKLVNKIENGKYPALREKMENTLRFILPIIYVLVLLFCLNRYLNVYFNNYRSDYSWSWQYGYKEAVNYIYDNYNDYDKIIITKKYGEPHEFVLFFTRWHPVRYIADKNLIRFEQSDWFWVDRFDKFYFVNDWDIPSQEWQPFVLESAKEEINCREIKCLLVTSPGNAPKTWKKLETINFLDGNAAFEIYDNK